MLVIDCQEEITLSFTACVETTEGFLSHFNFPLYFESKQKYAWEALSIISNIFGRQQRNNFLSVDTWQKICGIGGVKYVLCFSPLMRWKGEAVVIHKVRSALRMPRRIPLTFTLCYALVDTVNAAEEDPQVPSGSDLHLSQSKNKTKEDNTSGTQHNKSDETADAPQSDGSPDLTSAQVSWKQSTCLWIASQNH